MNSNAKQQLQRLSDDIDRELAALNSGHFDAQSSRGMAANHQLQQRRDLKGHFQKVYSVHWAGRGQDLLVSASQDGKLIIWNANSTNKLNAIPLKSVWVMSVGFEQSNNQMVASGGLDNICSVFRIGNDMEVGSSMQPEKELEGHYGYISCTRFIEENKVITSSGDSTVRVWDINRGESISYFNEHTQDVMSVAICPSDKNVFLTGSVDKTCKLWDLRVSRPVTSFQALESKDDGRLNGYRVDETEEIDGVEITSKETFKAHESDVNWVTFFPDGNAFGSGSDDSSCRIFDLRAHQEINIMKEQSLLCGVTCVEFSSSGRLLFAGYDDHNLMSWDVLKPFDHNLDDVTPVQVFRRHDARVASLALHTDGKALATGSWDTTVRIYA